VTGRKRSSTGHGFRTARSSGYPQVIVTLCLILLACAASQAQAQTTRPRKSTKSTAAAPVDPSKWPLESFTVKGNSHFTRDQILALSGLKLGQPVTKEDFDAARDRMVASGAFLNVSCGYDPASSGKGYAATVEVTEVPELYPLHVEDLPLTDADVLAYAKKKDALAGPKIPGTKEAVTRYQDYIAQLLVTKNFTEPVKGELISENPPDLIVLFRPAIARPTISHVSFTGASVIPASTLQNKMSDVALGLPFSETTFRVLLDRNARPLYEAQGRMRVTFPKVSTSPDPNVRGVIVAVDVNEGPVYKLGNIRVTGLAGRESELVKLIDLKPGVVIDFDQIKAGAQRMEHNLRREGYLKVSSDYARTFNDTAKTVDVIVKVDPGPQFKFTQLNVVGLDIETEPTIRKMWGLQAGKPYNIDYPEHFLARVKEDGVFDGLKNSRFESKIDPDSYEVEVTLYFNEKIKPPDK
jgi:outer membrane protein insertion porin family